MIQHIRIDKPPLIKKQTLLHLGRVNIISGRNSSGKSTILRNILEDPDIGFTFHPSEERELIIRSRIPSYTNPTRDQIDDWVSKINNFLDNQILFTSSEHEVMELIIQAANSSSAKTYNLNDNSLQIARILVENKLNPNKVVLLSPKRRMPYVTKANVLEKLDSEATNALSRLFFLKNQMPDSLERQVYDKVHSHFHDITGDEFDIQLISDKHPPEIQLQFRRKGGSWIVAQNEGAGLLEVLTIILYSIDDNYELILIEEPENHLHPDYQRRLLNILNTIEDRQFILSTHSPVFLNPTMVDRIYFSKYIGGEIHIDDNTSRADAMSDLGVLAIDNLTSDAILITEGKTDLIVIDHIVRKWLKSAPNSSISHVFLGGSMMKYFDPTPFVELKNTFALIDLDTNNKDAQKAFLDICIKNGLTPTQLSRYCLENYYPLEAIKSVFGDIVPNEITRLDYTIPPWKQLADTIHDESWWKGELKSSRRIYSIMNYMSISDIEESDLLEFCKRINSTI